MSEVEIGLTLPAWLKMLGDQLDKASRYPAEEWEGSGGLPFVLMSHQLAEVIADDAQEFRLTPEGAPVAEPLRLIAHTLSAQPRIPAFVPLDIEGNRRIRLSAETLDSLAAHVAAALALLETQDE